MTASFQPLPYCTTPAIQLSHSDALLILLSAMAVSTPWLQLKAPVGNAADIHVCNNNCLPMSLIAVSVRTFVQLSVMRRIANVYMFMVMFMVMPMNMRLIVTMLVVMTMFLLMTVIMSVTVTVTVTVTVICDL